MARLTKEDRLIEAERAQAMAFAKELSDVQELVVLTGDFMREPPYDRTAMQLSCFVQDIQSRRDRLVDEMQRLSDAVARQAGRLSESGDVENTLGCVMGQGYELDRQVGEYVLLQQTTDRMARASGYFVPVAVRSFDRRKFWHLRCYEVVGGSGEAWKIQIRPESIAEQRKAGDVEYLLQSYEEEWLAYRALKQLLG